MKVTLVFRYPVAIYRGINSLCHSNSNRYGEVYWTMMDPVPLDPNLVSRFKDKTMAIVGYESDQVYN